MLSHMTRLLSSWFYTSQIIIKPTPVFILLVLKSIYHITRDLSYLYRITTYYILSSALQSIDS